MRLGWIACCVVALTACAAPQWSRPGATAQDLEKDKEQCGGRALSTLPINMVMISTGWDSPPRRECTSSPSGPNCVNVPGIPAAPRLTDVNETPRAKLADACLKSLGWSR